jgi:hypothetical protein
MHQPTGPPTHNIHINHSTKQQTTDPPNHRKTPPNHQSNPPPRSINTPTHQSINPSSHQSTGPNPFVERERFGIRETLFNRKVSKLYNFVYRKQCGKVENMYYSNFPSLQWNTNTRYSFCHDIGFINPCMDWELVVIVIEGVNKGNNPPIQQTTIPSIDPLEIKYQSTHPPINLSQSMSGTGRKQRNTF